MAIVVTVDVRCDDAKIHDIAIHGDFNTPNNDVIDIEDSNNTIITRCHIDTGDDAICPKSSTGPVYNLTDQSRPHMEHEQVRLGNPTWNMMNKSNGSNTQIISSNCEKTTSMCKPESWEKTAKKANNLSRKRWMDLRRQARKTPLAKGD
ncbi:hypothetical protein KSP40_PGU017027 [Platanthera guangdongensis]|uniref:Uncharacterized protein n=1 Tax=Platanthera guangdongensis TaxID=2320717 RepID=A0ABR2M114_9ASPA